MTIAAIQRPTNDYDPLWPAYWAANPHLLRSVGAAAAGEGGDGGSGAGAGGAGGEGGTGGGAGEGGTAGAAGGAGGERKAAMGGDGGAGEAGKTGGEGGAAPNWRDAIADEELRKHVERFNTLADLAKAHLDLRKTLSSKTAVPGENATPEEIAAFRKAMGVPDAPDGYTFEMPEGREATDADKAFQGTMAKVFHEAGLSPTQAKALNAAWNQLTAASEAEVVKADKAFAEAADKALREAWGADYDRNKEAASRAAKTVFGADFDAIRQLETKDGRFVLDDPRFVKALATIGREMGEGRVFAMDEADRKSLDEQIKTLQRQKMEAFDKGDRRRAAELDAQLLHLRQRAGTGPIVGTQGRAA